MIFPSKKQNFLHEFKLDDYFIQEDFIRDFPITAKPVGTIDHFFPKIHRFVFPRKALKTLLYIASGAIGIMLKL
jgi:hypothetical protein